MPERYKLYISNSTLNSLDEMGIDIGAVQLCDRKIEYENKRLDFLEKGKS